MIKRMIYAYLLFLPVLMLVACKKEHSVGFLNDGEVEVEMKFPDLMRTRVPIAGENAIHTVDLLVFDASDASNEGEAEYLYSRYAWLKSGSTYRAVLKKGENLNVYVAINAGSLIDAMNSSMASGTTYTYADVKEMLIMSDPDQISLTNGLMMWGIALDRAITDASINDLGTIKLLRSVASTDITLNTDVDFTLAGGYIVYGADKGYLPYSSTNTSAADANGDFQSLLPEAPSGITTVKEWSSTPTAANQICNVFYMYDNDADGTGTKKQTKVVLEGVWTGTGSSGRTTFYPLAFRDPVSNAKLQVKRNSKYMIVITNVNGDGYETLEEAKEAEDVNMDYEIIEWNQNNDGDILIDGTKYFSISSKNAVLSSQTGAAAELVFKTNYALGDILMKYDDGDTGIADVIDTHNRFKVEVLTKNVDGNTYTCFQITAKQEYGTSDNPAELVVTVGRIKFTIYMEQVQKKWELGGDQDYNLTYP